MWENDFPHLHSISQLHWALDIKYKFDQHNDTSFQYLWPIGSPEPLTVKSEKSSFWRNWFTGWPKIGSMKYRIFFWPWKYDYWLWPYQNTNLLSFFTSITINANFHGYFVSYWWRTIFYDFTTFFGAKWFKKMAILCFDQCQSKCSYF